MSYTESDRSPDHRPPWQRPASIKETVIWLGSVGSSLWLVWTAFNLLPSETKTRQQLLNHSITAPSATPRPVAIATTTSGGPSPRITATPESGYLSNSGLKYLRTFFEPPTATPKPEMSHPSLDGIR